MTNAQALTELGLTGTPDANEIKKAYRAACLKTHPDSGGSADGFARTAHAYAVLTGRAQPTVNQPQAATPSPKPQPVKIKVYGNPKISREDWLHTAYAHIEAHAGLAGLAVPAVRLSVGYGLGGRRNKKGWDIIHQTENAVPQAFISPLRSEAKDVLSVVLGAACGLLDVAAGEALAAIWPIFADEVGKAMGPYPHSATIDQPSKIAGTRMLKVACPACGYTVRIAQKWINVGLPKCCGKKMEIA